MGASPRSLRMPALLRIILLQAVSTLGGYVWGLGLIGYRWPILYQMVENAVYVSVVLLSIGLIVAAKAAWKPALVALGLLGYLLFLVRREPYLWLDEDGRAAAIGILMLTPCYFGIGYFTRVRAWAAAWAIVAFIAVSIAILVRNTYVLDSGIGYYRYWIR